MFLDDISKINTNLYVISKNICSSK